jgi:hypothetical protein
LLIAPVVGCLFWSSCYGASATGKGESFPFFLDFSPGFTTTWFLSKKKDLAVDRGVQNDPSILGALQLASRKKGATFQLDHIPITLAGGEYTLTLTTRSKGGDNKVASELIRMRSDSAGRFGKRHTKKVNLGDQQSVTQSIRFSGIVPGDYILRFNGYLAGQGASISFSGFGFNGAGLAAKPPAIQVAPAISDVLFFPGQQVEIGTKLFMAQESPCTVTVRITDEQGNDIADRMLGSFNRPGVHDVAFTFVPERFGFYLVHFQLVTESGGKLDRYILQKSFSVIPERESPFMGLHCNGPDHNREELILGRKAGFMHYRDHDFGAFTRWSVVQPERKEHDISPTSFTWHHDRDIAFISEVLGYNYLGVLFQPPDWARDESLSRNDHPVHVPRMDAWRRYVREVIKRYSVEKQLIKEWEVWNEGKGVTGKKLKDHSIYLELLQSGLDEIATLTTGKETGKSLRIVAFGGIDRENIWRKVLAETKGFATASIHWKASRYRDTYFPAQRQGRVRDKRFMRDGWPTRSRQVLQEDGTAVMELWDTEGGLLNQNRPIYTFSSPDRTQYMPIANRQADKRYNPDTPWNYGPVDPLEGAAIMAKQVVAHLAAGVKRLYIYSFLPRDFVSAGYAPHMLEYDGTLKPYGHAFIIAAKFLNDLRYVDRDSRGDGLVCEEFADAENRITAACWNERDGKVEISLPENKEAYTMMGMPIPRPEAGRYFISTHPLYVAERQQ